MKAAATRAVLKQILRDQSKPKGHDKILRPLGKRRQLNTRTFPLKRVKMVITLVLIL